MISGGAHHPTILADDDVEGEEGRPGSPELIPRAEAGEIDRVGRHR